MHLTDETFTPHSISEERERVGFLAVKWSKSLNTE